MSAGNETTFN